MLSPIDLVSNYTPPVPASSKPSRGMVDVVIAARWSCHLCGSRATAPVHPLHPETGVPWCQMPGVT